MQRKITIAAGLGVTLMGIGIERIWNEIPGHWFILFGFIVIVFGVFWPFILKIYGKLFHTHKKPGLPDQEPNDPELFPDLNETALKKHIDLQVSECHASEIIETICLYQGVVKHYQLIVRAPEYHKGFSVLQRHWEEDPNYLFGEHFVEVYQSKPSVILPYQNGSFWHDWSCMVVDTGTLLPNTLVLKEPKWLLYKK